MVPQLLAQDSKCATVLFIYTFGAHAVRNYRRQALNDASNTQLNTAGQVQGQYQHNGSDAKRMRS